MTNPHPPKDVHIKVKVTDVAAETFVFESSDITVGPDNHLTFDNGDNHSGFHISYELVGADGYRFLDELDDALWAKVGSKTYCPQSKSGWGQFEAIELKDAAGPGGEKRILKVWNKNRTRRDFSYTLRAKKVSDLLTLDPGGTNNNGGFDDPFLSSNVIVGAVATAAVIAVVFFAFR